MFYIIGLGLGDAKDITVKGLEIIRKCDVVFLEGYTSILGVNHKQLEEFYGKTVTVADREMVELASDGILDRASSENVAFLVVGDPFGATTHSDLILRCREKGIAYQVVHNASIMNAVSCCGLQLYNFGETVSIPLWTDTWKPQSFYDKILANSTRGLHTLCLLDIKVKEQSEEDLIKGRKVYGPPRFMTVNQAVKQLLSIASDEEEKGVPENKLAFTKDSLGVGLARVGTDSQKIVASSLSKLLEVDFGAPLHSLVIAGKMHPLETEFVEQFLL